MQKHFRKPLPLPVKWWTLMNFMLGLIPKKFSWLLSKQASAMPNAESRSRRDPRNELPSLPKAVGTLAMMMAHVLMMSDLFVW